MKSTHLADDICRIVWAIREIPGANESIKHLHSEQQDFLKAIKEVEKVFGFRTTYRNSGTLPQKKLVALRDHLTNSKAAITELSQKLPTPIDGEPNSRQHLTQWMSLTYNQRQISKMQENVAVMRDLLTLYISLAQV